MTEKSSFRLKRLYEIEEDREAFSLLAQQAGESAQPEDIFVYKIVTKRSTTVRVEGGQPEKLDDTVSDEQDRSGIMTSSTMFPITTTKAATLNA